jgi:hypothetical protein
MPKQRTTVIDTYQFDELDGCAKERARDWYRGCIESDDFDWALGDCAEALKALGFSVGNRHNKRAIYWSLNPIDAAFDATWSASRFAPNALLKDRPTDKELHRIAEALRVLVGQMPEASGSCDSGRNCNQTAEFYAGDDSNDSGMNDDPAAEFECVVTDLAHWIATAVNAEYEYRYSAECVDENIRCNEYDFDENGKRV